jgi:DNA-directed RNA polymerase specialized sigma24 family protein
MKSRTPLAFSVIPFHTTRWTCVGLAQTDSEVGERALAQLCEAYYEPVIAYLRGFLHDAEAAQDMAHSFFEKMLGEGTMKSANREQGRFRFYLLGAVKHFVSHERAAASRLKRGGGVSPLSLDALMEEDSAHVHVADLSLLSPEVAFDRAWALTVLKRAMEALRLECVDAGKEALYDELHPWLQGESQHGDQAKTAASLGMTVGAMKVALHRLRQRFRQCVKTEVAGTLKDETFVEEEMRSLLAAL